MDAHRGTAEEFAELAMRLHEEQSVHDTLDRLLEHSTKALSCAYAGVVFVHARRRIESRAATHPLVEELTAVQTECGEGPDLAVLKGTPMVTVHDTRREERWPRWSERVAAAGIHSLVCVRIHTDRSTIGTLSFYDPAPARFDAEDEAVAQLLARHAAVALDSARNEENLWQAVDARKLIGQAQGILMERYQLTAEQAFAVLLRYSQDNNLKLRAVAERLISTRELPD